MYVRGGHILPLQMRARRSTVTMARDPYTIVVYPDARGEASGTLYVDDGETTDYESGSFALLRFAFAGGRLSVEVDAAGALRSTVSVERVVVMGGAAPGGAAPDVRLGGRQLHAERGPSAFFPEADAHAVTVKTVGELDVDTSSRGGAPAVVEIVQRR